MTVQDARGRVLCDRCVVADRPLARLRGLLGRAGLAPGEALLLRPAPSIHTWFMRFPIDAVFLDADLRVLDVRVAVRPWRVAGRRGARAVLEVAAGAAARHGLQAGEQLRAVEAGPTPLAASGATP
jgi:uncharacterized membrane protein (UPF0127 family)